MIYILLFAIIVFVKVCVFSFLMMNPQTFFSGGNDGDYYDAYARGADLVTSSIWPDVLRFLNDCGLYSRSGVSFVLMLLGVVFIPWMVSRLCIERTAGSDKSICYLALVVMSAYPTLFYYTLDIYRDVAMLFVFLLGIFAVRASIESRTLLGKLAAVLVVFVVGGALFLLRGYLGFAFVVSFLLFKLVRFRRFGVVTHGVSILILLNLFFAFGYLRPLMKYRELFDSLQGGSNLGIRFESISGFIPDFLESFSGQLFGFFFPNGFSIVLFVLESAPFILGLGYVLLNRRYSSALIDFIYVFSITYSIIWILGNDNLGTAARLRMYNYVGVLIACFLIYQRKRLANGMGLDRQVPLAE